MSRIVSIVVSVQPPPVGRQEQTFSSIHPPLLLLLHDRLRGFPAARHGVHRHLVIPGGIVENCQLYIEPEGIAIVGPLLNRSG